MSVESGGAPTEDPGMAEALRDAGQHVFAYLYESFAASLFDYCAGILRDPWAAAEVVQDSLVAVDVQMTKLPDPDQIRLWLYSIARQQCLAKLPGHQVKQSSRPETITLDEFIGEQAGSTDRYPDAGTVATEREKLRIVTAAVDSLADRDREVVNLAFRHGIADADLAAVLGVSHRRALALLSGASTQFRASAMVIAVLRAGRPGCQVLAGIAAQGDPTATLLTPKLRKQLAQHVASCASCAQRRGDREFGPELLTAVPFTTPPVNLGLRISRTATALGTHRSGVTGRSRKGALRGTSGARRGVSRSVVAPSVAVAVLIVPGALLYRLVEASFAGPAAEVTVAAAGAQSPAAAGSSLNSSAAASPALARKARTHRHGLQPLPVLGPLPGVLGPAPVGVLPVPSPGKGGAPAPGTPHPNPPAPAPPPTAPAPPPTAPAPPPTAPAPPPTTPAPPPTTPAPPPTTPAPPPTTPAPPPTTSAPPPTTPAPAPTASSS